MYSEHELVQKVSSWTKKRWSYIAAILQIHWTFWNFRKKMIIDMH